MQAAFGSPVAAVAGVHHGLLPLTHVAHHKQLVALLNTETGLRWNIAPGAVTLWASVMGGLYDAKNLSCQLRESITSNNKAIEERKRRINKYEKVVQQLDNKLVDAVVSCAWVVVGVAGEVATTSIGLPGLGTAGAASGKVAYEVERAAFAAFLTYLLDRNRKACQILQEQVQHDKHQIIQMCEGVQGEQAFDDYITEIKNLVYN